LYLTDEVVLDNLTILVTGATIGGIGYETAKSLAAMGHKLILTCRRKDRADKAAEEMCAEENCIQPDTYALDLSEPASVEDFCNRFEESGLKIDVLINNAGYLKVIKEVNSLNWDMSMAVNYIGTRKLTTLLLPKINRGGRIINVSSSISSLGDLREDDLFLEKNWEGFKAYSNSKQALNLYTRELAGQLKDKEITVNALHPGNIITNIWNLWPGNKLLKLLISLIEKTKILSAEKGAQTSIYLAVSPEVKNATSGFYRKKRLVKWPSNCSLNEETGSILQSLHQYHIV